MSESVGCTQPEDSAPRKRCTAQQQQEQEDDDGSGPTPCKSSKVTTDETSGEQPSASQSLPSEEVERKESTTTTTTTTNNAAIKVGQGEPSPAKSDQTDTNASGDQTGVAVEAHPSHLPGSSNARGGGGGVGHECPPSTSMDQSDDSAAIAAAEALASLTAGAGEDSKKTSSSSNKVKRDDREGKVKPGVRDYLKHSLKTLAAAADSSTSVHGGAKRDVEDIPDSEDDPGTTPGSSSSASSSFPSDNEDEEEDGDDGECAIVSVKMAPEIRQSVALLAQVQMRLETLEKKSVRLHQRLDTKMKRQRRPHLDQRSTITQSIPGFWVTALLNHPHLSAHIDETDEDALSYMIDLEIESFKNSKLGSRIRFHFRRNPYFQNNIIMKEVHLGMGGSPVSFSNPILWHRGQNLTVHSEPRKSTHGVYQTFFSWFGDHSNPGRDDIAQILKDDLYRDPLRYYLTPLWEPRENGSSTSGAKAADNSNGDDCVTGNISSSDESAEEEGGEIVIGGSDDSDQEARDEEEEEEEEEEEDDSFGDKNEEVSVEDAEGSPGEPKAKARGVEEDIDVDQGGDGEDQSKD
ncbi:hypothetical protein NHX12_012531 [Muraenolepis orangiensis]|uniref:Testis specific protein Y-linked n=1 Tax=Muraenolepis orangiensis TaxID=630683 RepID=A0A9Q0DFM2_9TELE|nr:hypothetical protein NHX12_012531 [Muraenolepis orangiensis]